MDVKIKGKGVPLYNNQIIRKVKWTRTRKKNICAKKQFLHFYSTF